MSEANLFLTQFGQVVKVTDRKILNYTNICIVDPQRIGKRAAINRQILSTNIS